MQGPVEERLQGQMMLRHPLKARRLGCIGFRGGAGRNVLRVASTLKPLKWSVRQARRLTGFRRGGSGAGKNV